MKYLDTKVKRVKFAREGASVKRMHTSPLIQQQTNGQHTFNMLCMLMILHPTPHMCTRLFWAITQHDIPEKLIGDTPAPAKWYGIIDAQKVEDVERSVNTAVFGENCADGLTVDDEKWLKSLDLLEFYLNCKDEVALGNRNMIFKVKDCEIHIENIKSQWPRQVVDFYYEVRDADWHILPDLGLEDWR